MADLIKKIKIKKQDGTFTDYIPIGAEAQNISTNDGDSVQLKLNKKPYYYDTVADMKVDTKLKIGDVVITLGYNTISDNGGAEYKIVSSTNRYAELLNNNLKAELIIKDYVTPEQFGAKGDGITDDSLSFKNAINYNVPIKCFKNALYKIKNINIEDNNLIILGNDCSFICGYEDTTEITKNYPENSCFFYDNPPSSNQQYHGIVYVENCSFDGNIDSFTTLATYNAFGFYFKRKTHVDFYNVTTKKFLNTVYALEACQKINYKDCSSYDISLNDAVVKNASSRNVFEFYHNTTTYNANPNNYGCEVIIDGYTAKNIHDEFARVDHCKKYVLKNSYIENLALVTEAHSASYNPIIDNKNFIIDKCLFNNVHGIISTDNQNPTDFTDFCYITNCTGINLKRSIILINKKNTYLSMENNNFTITKSSPTRGYLDSVITLQGFSNVRMDNCIINDIATLDTSETSSAYDFIYNYGGTGFNLEINNCKINTVNDYFLNFHGTTSVHIWNVSLLNSQIKCVDLPFVSDIHFLENCKIESCNIVLNKGAFSTGGRLYLKCAEETAEHKCSISILNNYIESDYYQILTVDRATFNTIIGNTVKCTGSSVQNHGKIAPGSQTFIFADNISNYSGYYIGSDPIIPTGCKSIIRDNIWPTSFSGTPTIEHNNIGIVINN